MDELERQLKRVLQTGDSAAPAFDDVYASAGSRLVNRRLRRRAALATAAAASVAILVTFLPTNETPGLISEDELLGTTSWSPPSDVLLPARHTNIFDELPALPESTVPVGETLL